MIDTYESVTAKLCSFARAYHSNWVKSKIFDDYLAYDLMGGDEYEEIGQLIERGFKFGEYRQSCKFDSKKVYTLIDTYISPIPLSRIAYAENELAEFAGRHEICQYVICGAGMDTFSFRNDNDNIRIFELDHPDTQKYKLKKIKELEWNIPENVRFVPIDFAKDDMKKVLIKAGFNPEIPTFFAILGVTYYLTLSVFEDTLKNISELSPAGSEIVFDYPDETTFSKRGAKRVQKLTQITESLGEPMRHGFSIGELENALNRHNFSIKEHFAPKDIQAKFFNGRDDGQRAFENIHFISTVKETKQMNTHIFKSESVTKGHPDKVSDIISDSILDAYISKDENARVAAETAVKNNTIVLLGEISSDADVDIESVVRNAVKSIGYNKAELGFNADTAAVINLLDKQSPDIAQGVDRALEARNKNDKEQLGAGDQGMVFGYASDWSEDKLYYEN